jgi:hypothetical protein
MSSVDLGWQREVSMTTTVGWTHLGSSQPPESNVGGTSYS